MSTPLSPILRRAFERLRALPPTEQERHAQRILRDLTPPDEAVTAHAWLDDLAEAGIDGPPDWSERVNEYLTGARSVEAPPETDA